MTTEAIQAPTKGHLVYFDYEHALDPAITSKGIVSLVRAYQLVFDRPEDIVEAVVQSYPDLKQSHVVLGSLSAQEGPKHWGTLIEVEYQIIGGKAVWRKTNRYRQVFHLMMNPDGLSGRLFTQTKRFIHG